MGVQRICSTGGSDVSVEPSPGEFVDREDDRYYAIRNVDAMPPFFMSLVSNSDHWLFISSRGGLTAGRVSPEFALFPYVTDDKIHDCADVTGCKTVIRVHRDDRVLQWQPFITQKGSAFKTERNIYKNILGNKVCFEEVNSDLELAFRYTWMTCERYGFVRDCELVNLGADSVELTVIDGLQNILPAGVPRQLQSTSSNLVDAYKWNERDQATGLAMFTLYSGITDKPEPQEMLRANTCFCLGMSDRKILLSQEQLERCLRGEPQSDEAVARGVRGAYFAAESLDLAAGARERWMFVAEVEQTQAQVVDLRRALESGALSRQVVSNAVAEGSADLRRLMASVDGFQRTAEENVAVHHYANVLFNSLRGGLYHDQYWISARDFANSIRLFNRPLASRHKKLLESLPQKILYPELLSLVRQQGDSRLESLTYEYLPITFGRRHGDPSRPWNQFAIRLKDENGNPLLYYQGNWRDIFQNWEALSLSYPEFIESIIAKFVNASTIDGFNPYRITKEGIDWEVEDPDDPWSYIGYWGDHQIIYLVKLLEISRSFHPDRLSALLHHPIFSYANVPYRIKSFEELLADPKNTVDYRHALADEVEKRVSEYGADGKRLLDAGGEVYQVNLLEKLLVPLLSKLGNLILDGGIWLNTQRPEWNDANNALVGQGLSMVTLYYMRRYVSFLQTLLNGESGTVLLTKEVGAWLNECSQILKGARQPLQARQVDAAQRFALLEKLGQAFGRYREAVYRPATLGEKTAQGLEAISGLLADALAVIDHSISRNRREDGLYHAYNLMDFDGASIDVKHLYPMLEGQVAVLSSGAVSPDEAVRILGALFDSDMYRSDQHTFMLYPDRDLPGFLDKNHIADERLSEIPVLKKMLETGDEAIVLCDADGRCRFNAQLCNSATLNSALDARDEAYGDDLTAVRDRIQSLYEEVFNHQEFTGRSGGMFGYEGLGCIYWHMVSKLLLAVQELFFLALDHGAGAEICNQLGTYYYRIREGIGFNKTPAEYGAFPTDPYSHTPKHAGARQPGMTGQVKEEIITRFGELGIRVNNGIVHFQPALLRLREFLSESRSFEYLDVAGHWQDLEVPAGSLAFTWCQVPITYAVDNDAEVGFTITWDDGSQERFNGLELQVEASREIFSRSGRVRLIAVEFSDALLFREAA